MIGTTTDAAIQEESGREWQLWQPDFELIDQATALCLRNTQPPTVVTTLFGTGRYRMTALFPEVTPPRDRSNRSLQPSRPSDDLPFLTFAATRPASADGRILLLDNFLPAGPGDVLVESGTGRAWLLATDRLIDLQLRLRLAHRMMPRLRSVLQDGLAAHETGVLQ